MRIVGMLRGTKGYINRRLAACAIAAAGALVLAAAVSAAPASATISSIFTGMSSPAVTCTVQSGEYAGQRWCTAEPSRVASWDGTPIDVSVEFPPAPASGPDGNFPVIGVYHGWGGTKFLPTTNYAQRFLNLGFAVFSMTARGWFQSCGTAESRAKLPEWANCTHGYTHLDSMSYEARDPQYLLSQLADDGVIDPQRIGQFGPSYGGILSAQLGALNDRIMLPSGELAPWTSPAGKPMHSAAVVPQVPATDLAEALDPNGSTLDYVASSPYRGPLGDRRVGVQKATIMSGFYNGGLKKAYYAPAGADPSADMTDWFNWTNAAGPYDTPQINGMVQELTTHHSAYYVDDSEAPPPTFLASGLNDDFVPADESVRYYNKIRSDHPETPVAIAFGDIGHERSQDKGPTEKAITELQNTWLLYYVKGEGSKPQEGLTTFTDTCPAGTPAGGPFHFASYAAMEKGEVRVEGAEAKTIAATGTQFGSAFSAPEGTACTTKASTDNPATANYHTPAAPAGGYTVAGGTTIIAHLKVTGESDELAERLLDVSPEGKETLIERGLLRPELNSTAAQVFQLHPNVWHVDQGHSLKLELLPNDSPYSHINATTPDSAAQHPIVVSELQARIPVMDAPGSAGGIVQATAPRVLPPGYTYAYDYLPPDTTIESGPSTTTSNASPSFTFSSSKAGSSFECRVDAGGWQACSSPDAIGPLTDGEHTFEVRAVDSAGNADQTPAAQSFTVDTAAPETTIESGPGSTTSDSSPFFTFSSSKPASTFECRLDSTATGDWHTCSSPDGVGPLADGEHTFEVRATDAVGNTDATPAVQSFTVDTTAPDTTIESGPSGAIAQASASFGFGSSEDGTTFECQLDSGGWQSCSSPDTVGPLPDGGHSFEVRAVDSVGNADQTPAVRGFTVDTTPPTLEIVCPATAAVGSSASASVSASDAGSGLAGDPSGAVQIDTNKTGPQTIERTAVDNVGNSTSTACTTEVVNTTVIGGRVKHKLLVKAGEAVELTASAVTNQIEVQAGGSLDVEGATTKGIKAASPGVISICGARASSVRVTGASGPITLGDGEGCAGSSFSAGIVLQANSGAVNMIGNTIKGSVKVAGNSGGVDVKANTIAKNLTVSANSGTVVDQPNSVGGKVKAQARRNAKR